MSREAATKGGIIMTDFKAKMRAEVKLAVLSILDQYTYPFQSCINCEHFTEDEKCKLFNTRPPAKIIVLGCEKWQDKDGIPF
jgi:hypothetical protein